MIIMVWTSNFGVTLFGHNKNFSPSIFQIIEVMLKTESMQLVHRLSNPISTSSQELQYTPMFTNRSSEWSRNTLQLQQSIQMSSTSLSHAITSHLASDSCRDTFS